ncbi:MAG TPA: hypothetical protein PKE54_09085, partial [Candidatus Obscuribacter sp.]|nr:hypothetical protein [Candidatus Obscuribacter sp.]
NPVPRLFRNSLPTSAEYTPGPNPPPNHVITDLSRLQNSGACINAFTAQTCINPPAGANNLERYQAQGFYTAPTELFPYVFEHLIGATTGNPPAYSVDLDLETVIQTQFLDMSTYIQGMISQPPPAAN